jgi:uncharacterized protein DUF4287
MTFEAYISNIRTKTGKDPRDFFDEAIRSGVLRPETKAMEPTSLGPEASRTR